MRVLLVLCLTLAAACGVDDELVNGGDPYVKILTPEDGETVCGDPLHVELEVDNLTLVEPVDDPDQAVRGTGHADLMLNGQDADMVWDTTADIEGVHDGEWQLKVELSNADHTPVEPYAADLIYVTVSATSCP